VLIYIAAEDKLLLVMKFGGTSVGSAERVRQAAVLVRTRVDDKDIPIVVLSAMSGVTNSLLAAARLAEQRQLEEAAREISGIRQKHERLVRELFADQTVRQQVQDKLEPHLDQIDIVLQGIACLGELSKRSLDTVAGFGELLSSTVFAHYLKDIGVQSVWVDARQFMVTDDEFGSAMPLWQETETKANQVIEPLIQNHQVPVTQGFIGATASGASTTLGRGGSDFSASIIGVALDAEEIQIWTDVDGMMTADPRLVPEAHLLSEVSFQEASELAYFGAKVLHPLTIKPAIEKKIPVRILNTMRPECSGTLISHNPKIDSVYPHVRSISSKKGLTAIFIHSPRMLMTHGFLAKVFDVFAQYETPIDMIATAEVSISLTTDHIESLSKIIDALEELGDEVKVMHDVAIVSVVGQHIRTKSGIAGKIFGALEDINLIMISSGASDVNINFVVDNDDADRAVQQLHASLFPKPVGVLSL
jgi:aspartate kinase